MKTVLTTLVLCLSTFWISAIAQNPIPARGCVLLKRSSEASASFHEYRTFQDFGTNIAVTDVAGNLLTVFHGEKPIFIPYPTDPAATLAKATTEIARARKTYPELSRRLTVIEKAWAAAPRSKAAATPAPLAAQQTPTVSKPLPDEKPNGTDVVTISGTKYVNVTIIRTEPDGLVVMTDAGLEKIPFAVLPKELQTKYGYDPQKAAQFKSAVQSAAMQRQVAAGAAQAAADAAEATRKQLEENPPVRILGKVTQSRDTGLLVDTYISTEFISLV